MPNYILCDQFHVRIPVLVHTRTASKGNSGSKVNGTKVLCFVLNCLGLYRIKSYVEYQASQEPRRVSYTWHES